MKKNRLTRLLRWAGGKKQLIPNLIKRVPPQFNNYHEPFVGGGAMVYEMEILSLLKNKKIYILDKNEELVSFYRVIKTRPKKFISEVEELIIKKLDTFGRDEEYNAFYYDIRDWDRDTELFKSKSKLIKAARFLYLNKSCFNGLYRVNKSGYFNVPFDRTKKNVAYSSEIILSWSKMLKRAEIASGDFSQLSKSIKKGDFVYLDPPYYPITETSFTTYTESGFDQKDHERLKDFCDLINKKKAYFLLSNSYHDNLKHIYKKYKIETVGARRSINSKKDGRGKVPELLISNYL